MEPSLEVSVLSSGAMDEETRAVLSGSCPVIKILHFNFNRLCPASWPPSYKSSVNQLIFISKIKDD